MALLMWSNLAPRSGYGCVPFDLTDFRDHSSSPAKTLGFSAFDVDAANNKNNNHDTDDEDACLDDVSRLQHLFEEKGLVAVENTDMALRKG
uniref:Uncharacterized protein n=1 Tax=Oryza sativa subsp. japonica TaxID=39947 RepID=Q6YWN3_ORYSJ|nr:hypothetical protein [Oryza sativa Japonica Group]